MKIIALRADIFTKPLLNLIISLCDINQWMVMNYGKVEFIENFSLCLKINVFKNFLII